MRFGFIASSGRGVLTVCLILASGALRAAAVPDAARALHAGGGTVAAAPPDMALLDVANGPGVDLRDAVRLARRAAGLDPAPGPDYAFSFEDGWQGWYPMGTDLDHPVVDWSITPSQELASEGARSMRLYLANYNDAGKIWLERPFRLKPHTRYAVTVRYDFATAAWGDFNLWTIITGVHAKPPRTRDDLTYQGNTGNGQPGPVGYVWLEKSYTFDAETDAEAVLYAAIGIWGTWESPGTYYVDNVRITFIEVS